MMINSDINMAIVQFGHKENEEELQKITKQLAREELAHWYYFDETADREFEIAALRPHYDIIYEYMGNQSFKEIKE